MPLPPGARLGPYEILAPLGAGGMGEVYRARDARLGRTVAIKVLPPDVSANREWRARFEREARTASALNHPGIITVHEFGSDAGSGYLVMECVEGRTLRELLREGLLPARRLLDIAAQIADGLACAHSAGIAHRDLKPENIMVTKDGVAKILDFGLSKVTEPSPGRGAEVARDVDSAVETRSGAMQGTTRYMSPEQAGGGRADFRSDQFALGVILYEMVGGRHPFVRPTTVETLAAIVKDEPSPLGGPRPGIPPGLHRLVERCLAKDPEHRYGSTRDLARDLRDLRDETTAAALRDRATVTSGRYRWWRVGIAAAGLLAAGIAAGRARRPLPSTIAPSPGAEISRSIAVLPLRALGGAADEEYFSDGMTEAIITDLGKVRGLLVIGRSAMFRYKGSTVDVKTVGKDLAVDYVLEGNARRADQTLRVNVQLVDVRTGYQVWADRYDRSAQDIFAVQDDISRHVVGALRLKLVRGASDSAPTANLDAYEAYLRGLFFAHQVGPDENDKAIRSLQEAVAFDPQFGPAHAALAWEYSRKAFANDPGREWEARAFVEVEKALAIDAGLSLPYVVRGNLLWTLANGFQHERAAASHRRALSIDPNSELAHSALASVYAHVGLFDRALEHFDAALRRGAGAAAVALRVSRVYLYRQEYEPALNLLRANPEVARSWQTVSALDHLGRRQEARALVEELVSEAEKSGDAEALSDAASMRAILSARMGDRSRVEKDVVLSARRGSGMSHFHHAAYNMASAYALLGRNVEALAWLRRTANEGMPCYALFASDPNLDGLRSDRDFAAFLAGIKAESERLAAVL